MAGLEACPGRIHWKILCGSPSHGSSAGRRDVGASWWRGSVASLAANVAASAHGPGGGLSGPHPAIYASVAETTESWPPIEASSS
jgi:hypothetical protein